MDDLSMPIVPNPNASPFAQRLFATGESHTQQAKSPTLTHGQDLRTSVGPLLAVNSPFNGQHQTDDKASQTATGIKIEQHSIWDDQFIPNTPKTIADTGLNSVMLEDLALKVMLSKGAMTGRQFSQHLCLHYNLIDELLADLKGRLLLAHKSTAGIGDFLYMLTDTGRDKALRARDVSGYAGPAPVPFDDYVASIKAQSIRNEQPGYRQLKVAFQDLVLDEAMFDTLGPAVNSARGLFLYGEPGNGKTSIAERITQCFNNPIYIPRAISVDGQIIQLYDQQNHRPVTISDEQGNKTYDPRWMLIHRPIVMVGGELTLDALELTYNPLQKVCEAPLQMKANGGTFLIDDFGRQRVSHVELLNRWIVPLEKRVDFLVLPTGKKIEVPFDELIIFSTNINPHDLVDEAFLRRIPYKIHVQSPNEYTFKNLFKVIAPRYNFNVDDPTFEPLINYLVETHYRDKRPFRACQARDILEQVVNACHYHGETPVLSKALLDKACANYFAAMGQ
jgi:predicted ATPase with chaperone activity